MHGFFTGTEADGFEFMASVGLAGEEESLFTPLLYALLSVRADIFDSATSENVRLEQRLEPSDWQQWTDASGASRFAIAAFPIIEFNSSLGEFGDFEQKIHSGGAPGFAPALEGLLIGRGSRVEDPSATNASESAGSFVMGANALFDRGSNQGLERPEFFQQPFDVVLKDSGFGSNSVLRLPLAFSMWSGGSGIRDSPRMRRLMPIWE